MDAIEPQVEIPIRRRALARPDWRAALWAGIEAGIVAMLVQMVLMGSWRQPLRWMAGLSYDRGAFPPRAVLSTMWAAAVIYSGALCVEYACIIADFIHTQRRLGQALVVGMLVGLAVYWINFYGLTAYYPWLAEARVWPTLVSHMVFGAVAAWSYKSLAGSRALRR